MEKIPTNDMVIGYTPLPGSQKIYRPSDRFDDVQVPFRKITLSSTQLPDGAEEDDRRGGREGRWPSGADPS